VAHYVAKQGRETSHGVAKSLFEISPDVFGLRADIPADEDLIANVSGWLEDMRALPANDTAPPPARAAVAALALAPACDAGTSFAAPYTSAELARLIETVALAHGFTPRKCEPEPPTTRWLTGSYPTTTLRVYRIAIR
jgi:hypothetical protein